MLTSHLFCHIHIKMDLYISLFYHNFSSNCLMQTSNNFCEKLKAERFNFSQMFAFILTDLKFEIHSVMRIDHWPVLLQYIFILKIEITFFLSPVEKTLSENGPSFRMKLSRGCSCSPSTTINNREIRNKKASALPETYPFIMSTHVLHIDNSSP